MKSLKTSFDGFGSAERRLMVHGDKRANITTRFAAIHHRSKYSTRTRLSHRLF